MLLQDKKGLSIMIGYVLLVAIAIIMSMVVYQFIKTYVPREALECPDGVSVFIKETKYDCDTNNLEITLKNNGRFSIAGYFIHATTSEDQELATLDLSGKVSAGGDTYSNSMVFVLGKDNTLSPNDVKKTKFDLSGIGFDLDNHKIEIIPVRFQEEEGKTRFASCSNARVEEVLSCWVEPEVCEPNCDGRVCGDDGCLPYDETDCGTCTGVGEVCDADGQCVVCTPDCSCALTICVDETCLEYDCNTYCEGVIEPDCTGLVCGPALNGCGNETVCGPCDGTCVDGVCLVSSCNGEWEGAGEDPGVECDGTPTPANCVDCICNSGYIPDENGGCEPYIPGSVVNCADWCAYIGNREGGGYTTGICKQTPSKCDDVSGGAWVNIDEFDVDGLGDTGDHVSCGVSGVDDECDGDEYCTAGAQANTCCCEP